MLCQMTPYNLENIVFIVRGVKNDIQNFRDFGISCFCLQSFPRADNFTEKDSNIQAYSKAVHTAPGLRIQIYTNYVTMHRMLVSAR